MARSFRVKSCNMCGKEYTPTSPKQKFCVGCKKAAAKEAQKIRDKKKNRKLYSIEYERNCLACGKTFKTHYSRKRYCGRKECEQVRIQRKNNRTYIKIRTSKTEQLLKDFIEATFPEIKVVYKDRSILTRQELDFYFPDKKLAVEVCTFDMHEKAKDKSSSYHYDKMQACYDKGIRLITIFEDELLCKKEIVFSRIRQALGKPKRRVFARKCRVVEIDSKTANTFYMNNHIQGRSTALVRYGLYYKEELLCVGSLGKIVRKHTSSDTTIELKRFCTATGVSVVGGVGKIFKRMKIYAKENGYTMIKSYCDMRYANIFNPVYEVLGFELEGYTKYTPHYFKGFKRYRNYSLRKTPEERLTGKTEWELRQAQGYGRIWDCGHRTYVYML